MRHSIQSIKNVIKSIPVAKDVIKGNEYMLGQSIKKILPETNFELIGEELKFGNNGICDLWLANISNNFLLSAELKVGLYSENKKKRYLASQVSRYSKIMKDYYPMCPVYGLGVYECLDKKGIKFYDYVVDDDCMFDNKIIYNHFKEIKILKIRIQTELLSEC